MPQHDYVIDNASGAAVRADINSALAAIASTNRGPNPPSAPAAGMIWVDDNTPSASVWTVSMYDGADWIVLGLLDTAANFFLPSQVDSRVAKAGDTMTGNLTMQKSAPVIALDAAGATVAALDFRQGGVLRWRLQQWTDGEDIYLSAYTSGGVLIGNAVQVNSATRKVTFNGAVPQAAFDPAANNDLCRRSYVDGGDIYVRIADVAVTAASAIDVTWTAGAYRSVDVHLTGLRPSVSGASVNLLMRARQGGAFLAGASSYVTQIRSGQGSTGVDVEQTSTAVFMSHDGTNAALDELTGRVFVDPGAATTEPGIVGHTQHTGAAGRRHQTFGGAIPTLGAIDGLRFLWGGGATFAAVGRITVVGLKA